MLFHGRVFGRKCDGPCAREHFVNVVNVVSDIQTYLWVWGGGRLFCVYMGGVDIYIYIFLKS